MMEEAISEDGKRRGRIVNESKRRKVHAEEDKGRGRSVTTNKRRKVCAENDQGRGRGVTEHSTRIRIHLLLEAHFISVLALLIEDYAQPWWRSIRPTAHPFKWLRVEDREEYDSDKDYASDEGFANNDIEVVIQDGEFVNISFHRIDPKETEFFDCEVYRYDFKQEAVFLDPPLLTAHQQKALGFAPLRPLPRRRLQTYFKAWIEVHEETPTERHDKRYDIFVFDDDSYEVVEQDGDAFRCDHRECNEEERRCQKEDALTRVALRKMSLNNWKRAASNCLLDNFPYEIVGFTREGLVCVEQMDEPEVGPPELEGLSWGKEGADVAVTSFE